MVLLKQKMLEIAYHFVSRRNIGSFINFWRVTVIILDLRPNFDPKIVTFFRKSKKLVIKVIFEVRKRFLAYIKPGKCSKTHQNWITMKKVIKS